jgi:hypothetical protein
MRALLLVLLLVVFDTAGFHSLANDSGIVTRYSHQQESSLLTINCQLRVASADGFRFDRLRVQATYTRDHRLAESASGPIIPDQSGRVLISAPAGCWLNITISSYDPTLRHLSADADDWYSIGMGRVEILGSREFYLPADSPAQSNYNILLSRGAAFSLCVPSELKNGMVWFRGRSVRDHWRVFTFANASVLESIVIGGLEPGPIEVLYVDKQWRKRSSESLHLQRGTISSKRCN